MKLTYRGVGYEPINSYVDSVAGKVIGRYRGADLRSQHYTARPAVNPFINLQYRGAYYRPVTHIDPLTDLVSVF